MFDNNTNLYSYNYNVQLDEVVKIICDISFDIGKQIEEIIEVEQIELGFTIIDLFNDDFLKTIGIRRDALTTKLLEDESTIQGYTNEEFFSIIANHYNQTLFYTENFLSSLEGSDILFIDKLKGNLLSYGEKGYGRLVPALKAAKILKDLILQLKSEKIQKSLEKIEFFENDFVYRNTISTNKQQGQPLLSCLSTTFINTELVKIEKVDANDYWLNFELYQKFGFNLTEAEEYCVCYDIATDKEIGLIVSEYLLPYPNIDLTLFVFQEQLRNYFFTILNNTYKYKPINIPPVENEPILEDFKNLMVNEDLNKMLSFLKNNFIIINPSVIYEDFQKFFNKVVLLENLKHLENYQFLISSNIVDETAIGVYSNERKNSSFNLLHWLNHNGYDKVNHFRSAIPKENDKKIIQTLKPSIAYYFVKKYFEDMFESILVKNNFDFFSNCSFQHKGNLICEIDFFINTTTQFFYIETKTKLTKFYIEEFLKKSSMMIEKFKPMLERGVKIDFVLCGAYSDNTVEEYQYFIDESAEKIDLGYNISRANLDSKPFYFSVPIPDREGIKITCIAEPEYSKLENLVLSICQK